MFSGISTLDIFIAIFVLLVVVRGARIGFLAGILSLIGVIVGASIGSRVAQHLLPEGESAVLGALITLISILAFSVLGEIIARGVGSALRSRLSPSTRRPGVLDALGGAILGMALSLTLVWAVGVFALQTPLFALARPTVEGSRIISELDERMPSELLTNAVAQFDPLPQVSGPEVQLEEPDSGVLQDPEVLAASQSMVRITGIACGYGVEGSGWVAAPDLIVTNAHVVAGESVTRVQPGGAGRSYGADVVLFDVRNDIAVLRVPGLGMEPLPLDRPQTGEEAAVIGFPGNGPLDVQPARIGQTQRVISSDAYNRGPVERVVTSFRVFVRPGNSGGPAVNKDGEVVSTIFASRANSSSSGYGIPSQIVERKLTVASNQFSPIDSGPCAN